MFDTKQFNDQSVVIEQSKGHILNIVLRVIFFLETILKAFIYFTLKRNQVCASEPTDQLSYQNEL